MGRGSGAGKSLGSVPGKMVKVSVLEALFMMCLQHACLRKGRYRRKELPRRRTNKVYCLQRNPTALLGS